LTDYRNCDEPTYDCRGCTFSSTRSHDMTRHVLAVHHVTLLPRKARVTKTISLKRAGPVSSYEDATKVGCCTSKQPSIAIQHSPISDATQPPAPVFTSIADFHFDTDESDSEELSVPLITNVRCVINTGSPICISDTDTNQSFISDRPPMKKFRITLNLPTKVEAPTHIPLD